MPDRKAGVAALQQLKDAWQTWSRLPKDERLAVLDAASSFPWYFAATGSDPLSEDEVRTAIVAADPGRHEGVRSTG